MDDLSREELSRLLEAVRAMARVSADPDFDHVMDEVLHIALAATKSDRAGVYVQRDETTLELVGSHPRVPAEATHIHRVSMDSPIMGATMRGGVPRTFALGDLGEDRSDTARRYGAVTVAVIPLSLRGRISACVTLARTIDVPYDERELRMAAALGELLVVYVENARLYADARRRLEQTRVLLDVGRAMASSLELDQRFDASADMLARLVDASNVFILVLEEHGSVLRGVGASDPRHRDFVRTVRVDTSGPSIAARAVTTRKPATMADVSTSKEHARELAAHFAEKSAVALPLLVQGRAVGAIIMDDVRKVRVWTPIDIDRAELVAQHVATGIANARLYEEVRSRSEELERAQQELVKRERLAALGELAAVMAHEVRNPLGVLFNSLGTLGKVLPPGGDAGTLLDIMREEAERLERLVKELLDFARPLAPSFEQESVRAVIAGAVDAARRALAQGDDAGPAIGIDVAADVPTVRLDASMVRRALVNLVVNGYQAAGPSGRVSVRARRSGSFVEIDVLDTGPGIPPELTARVFEPFFTTKATGTGLGLAVVKSIVDSHGGEIDLRSRPGSGTTVTVVLPIDRDASERRAARPPSDRKLVP